MSIESDNFFVWPTSFSCIIALDNVLLSSDYSLSIGMLPTEVQNGSVIGLRKVKHFISKFVHQSIVIRDSHSLIPSIVPLSTNTVQLPQDPYDYFFAAALYRKLVAITKNHFTIQSITLDSSVGDRIKYHINETCNAYDDLLNQPNSWWNQDNVHTNYSENFPTWEDFNIVTPTKFCPRIIKGSKGEDKPI